MIEKKIRCIFSIVLASIISISLLSGCKQAESVPEETTVSETTAKYSEEELELMAQDMPEIVFVMSHHYDNSNIVGYYVTNTGEIKLYDFRQIAPDETYEIPDVYDKLEEATCSEIAPYVYWDEDSYQKEKIAEEDLLQISKYELINQYKKLLLVDCGNEGIFYDSMLGSEGGEYKGYGIRYLNSNEKEVVLLCSQGEYIYQRYDDYANDLFSWLRFDDYFPNIPTYQ